MKRLLTLDVENDMFTTINSEHWIDNTSKLMYYIGAEDMVIYDYKTAGGKNEGLL